jgi:microcompartment protein CcmK/EutM
MYIGRVSGTVVATIHQETFDRHKLLLVDKLDLDGRPTGYYDIAVDVVQAGVGDVVLVLDEGNSARQIIDKEPDGAIRAVIVGVVDEISVIRSQPAPAASSSRGSQ